MILLLALLLLTKKRIQPEGFNKCIRKGDIMLVTDSQFNVTKEKAEKTTSSLWSRLFSSWFSGVKKDSPEMEDHLDQGEYYRIC